MTRSSLLFAAAAAMLISHAASAETVQFHATMNTASEVPPKTTDGKGTAEASLDTATKTLTYTVTYSDLTGPAIAAHFHGPASPGQNAGILVPMTPPLTSPIHGTATLTDAQMADFMNNMVYVNVHTNANKGGEIRGQLTH